MNKLFQSLLALTLFCLCPPLASAQEVPWRITAFEGVVHVAQPGAPAHAASTTETLRPGATITTGANSRAALENGLQRIAIGANSRMSIAADSSNDMTRILQDLGSVLFQVDRRQTPHFRVETPLLAAVVKGTTFTVTAGGQQDMVHVAQGLVEVHANQGQAVSDVPAGRSARVERNAPGQIATVAPVDGATAAASISVPALNYASASGGLISGASHGDHASVARGTGQAGATNAGSDRVDNAGGGALTDSAAAHPGNGSRGNGGAGAENGGNGGDNGNGNGNGGDNGNGNGNGGDNGNGNGNGGDNGNGNGGDNGNGNGGDNGNGNGNGGDNGNGNGGDDDGNGQGRGRGGDNGDDNGNGGGGDGKG